MGIIPSFTVQMDVSDVLYLSWLIPEKKLRPAVPASINFAGILEDNAMISLVMFRSKNVTSSVFPFVHFSYNQANIRTYVIDPVTGMPAVFFLESGITSPLISFVTGLLGVPWRSIDMKLDVRYKDEHPYQYQVYGDWKGNFKIEFKGDNAPLNPAPFQNIEETIKFLTGPAVGFYGGPGKLIRFEVKHSAIKPYAGKLSTIQCPMLAGSGFVEEKDMIVPHSALIAAYGHFTVFMPPTILSI